MNSNNMPQTSHLTGSLLAIGITAVSFIAFDATTAAFSCILGWAMLTIAFIDARHMIIPDILSLPAIPAGLGTVWILTPKAHASLAVLEHLAVAIVAAGVFYLIRLGYHRLRKREGLGLGDVKLIAVAGAWTGFQGTSNIVLLSCFGAFCFILAQHIFRRKQMTATMALPFGTFLAPAIWLVWALGRLGVMPGMM